MIPFRTFLRPTTVGSFLLAAPAATAAFLTLSPPLFHTGCSRSTAASKSFSSSSAAIHALPKLVDGGTELTSDQVSERMAGKRVAYMFSAGWCPMCTRFDPSLMQFRQAANDSGKELEVIYVPSDRSSDDAAKRSKALGMLMVPYGEEADQLKRNFNIWAGSESIKFGFGRRSGVPALVVLDSSGEELEFLPAEAHGPNALAAWPLDDERGIW